MTATGSGAQPAPQLLVAGRLVAAADGAAYPAVDPATGEHVGEVPEAGPGDVDRALEAARRAVDGSPWARDRELRLHCLDQLHRALVAQAPELRELTTSVTGMPVALLESEYDEPVAALRRLLDAPHDPSPGPAPEVRAVITPATSPHGVAFDRIARALVSGHAALLRPAPATGRLACEVGRLAAEATDLPPGILSVLPGRDVDVAIALTTDPRVDAVDFAGSAVVADRVRFQAGAAGKRVDLEIGGPSTVAAGEDDLAEVVRCSAHAVTVHAGQRTGAPTRLVVPRRRYAEAVELAAAEMQAIRPGDPTDPTTVCGPVMSAVHRDRVRRYLALAGQEGGELVCGGGPVRGRDRGYWVEPAVVAGVGGDARVAREEILGPVLVVVPDEG